MAGHRARRARQALRAPNQHFLRSRRLAAELVRDSGVGSSDLVVELGAGTGLITLELERHARAVEAIELDGRLTKALRKRVGDRVRVVHDDMLRVKLPVEPFSVVANLPFGQTNAVLRLLLDDPRTPLRRADLVVEWGAAVKRSRVWPSTLLGVTWGAWYGFAIGRRLPAAMFSPPPAVDAAVLVVRRHPEPLIPVADWRRYRAFVRVGFENGLRAVVPPRRLRSTADRLGFPPAAAPRDLDAHQWARLFELSGVVRR